MDPENIGTKNIEDFRQQEVQLHLELTNICRRYISKIGIVPIIGILDIVKQETIEFERATNKDLDKNNQSSAGQEGFDRL